MSQIAFIDAEIEISTGRILDIGAVKEDGSELAERSAAGLLMFLEGVECVCGHNIFKHDVRYLGEFFRNAKIDEIVDTLPLSPLLFPSKPYHSLLKDDKIQTEDISNPLSDAYKARNLYYDEAAAFEGLDLNLKKIYSGLLRGCKEFESFFKIIDKKGEVKAEPTDLKSTIMAFFNDRICGTKDIQPFIDHNPVELAYALALIQTEDRYSIIPPWVMRSYPFVETVLNILRNTPCKEGCSYCLKGLNIYHELKRYFGYDSFRTFDGEPLQEKAVDSAVRNESLLAVFPTGGGKSMTFQLPALIGGESVRGLTVVISPLQSLMKDQVDNLEKIGLVDAVTINGQLDPIQRAYSIERVRDGSASILYIAPESLRSITIENLLLSRNVIRFVIDEAHCFSAWGHDFRIDYLFIGDFIKRLQEKKNKRESIPISCFTATARKRVIQDICLYFKEKLDIDLKLFVTRKRRHNLNYAILSKKDDDEKYMALRDLIDSKDCPTIVYVSRTRRAETLAARLSMDGFIAKPYHGQMDNRDKAEIQNKFIDGEVDVIVATSAFGMGVDKKDVGLVVHYNISDSLENYIQEAGRAGRDETIYADCYVLFSEKDLDMHLMQLNQTKLTIKEIQQIWKGIKGLSKLRSSITRTALEIADAAGWDDQIRDLETKVRAAIAALEHSGYVKRGHNRAKVYADSILAKNAQEAIEKIKSSDLFSEKQEENAIRIIRKLISSRSRSYVYEEAGESRVDYIADQLGLEQKDVIEAILLMREGKVLADHKDLTAFFETGGKYRGAKNLLSSFCLLENFLFTLLYQEERAYNLKQIREDAEEDGCRDVEISDIKRIFNYWKTHNWTDHKVQNHINRIAVRRLVDPEKMKELIEKRQEVARFVLEYLHDLYSYEKGKQEQEGKQSHEPAVGFSLNELKEAYNEGQIHMEFAQVDRKEIEDALMFLQKIGAVKLEGSLMVIYNAMFIERLEQDNYKNYKKDDYRQLKDHYESKTQQIHIVGKYAKDMIDDYKGALQFVDDYFQMDYTEFLRKYFPGKKDRERISKTITEAKFKEVFGSLSAAQLSIVNDSTSPCIVVAAGPGSGKTKLLVHKLAALMIMEDVRPEQLLMVTFSRAAATEFKRKLKALIGAAANFVDIKTFHSYCFDLLGKVGSLEKSETIIEEAIEKIRNEASLNRIIKTAMVIDEAQDMDSTEYEFIRTMIERNEGMKVIAVGDDDQNIFQFRGSSSEYMENFVKDLDARFYELTENYRSAINLVGFSNAFAKHLFGRLKTADIRAHRKEVGSIRIFQYSGSNLILPLVDFLSRDSAKGSLAVLTEENNDAQLVSGLLNDKGVPAKLIQSNEGFNLYNMLEVRYFTEQVRLYEEPHVISKEVWEKAKSSLKEQFKESTDFAICNNLLKSFETDNPNTKYKSDLDVFIRESNLEDFYSSRRGTVTVSTIHKSKGREFDKVYLMLKNGVGGSDEDRRKIYVALTRAKNELIILCNGVFFDKFGFQYMKIKKMWDVYSAPDEFMMQLSFRDAYLNQFFTCQRKIDKLVSGAKLSVDLSGCYDDENNMVLRFSRRFAGVVKRMSEKGCNLDFARIRHIVYWKKDEYKEIKILLVDVFFNSRK